MAHHEVTPADAVTAWSGWDVRGGAKAALSFAHPMQRRITSFSPSPHVAFGLPGF
jgi:hypothetical protein